MSIAPEPATVQSIWQKLRNLANDRQQPANEILQFYAMERLLYRLAESDYAALFILKGALTFQIWEVEPRRVTRDIDLLAEPITAEDVRKTFTEMLEADAPPKDGVTFDISNMQVKAMHGQTYLGFTVIIPAALGHMPVKVEVDIGQGDRVYPEPKRAEYPTLLDMPAPHLKYYTRETAIAEKVEAMHRLGQRNSRMKDFYDVWLLSRRFEFETETLRTAIYQTFERRKSELPKSVNELFSPERVEAMSPRWTQYRKKQGLEHSPATFAEVVNALHKLLSPVLDAETDQP